ncbi:MAG: BolA/IbaG family iron-sulfur metabolism protein, partial [Candidatus Omnitrophica bacterium]|nr:BolA/IbaG family iron-sulfur metabolism protein [Candidatus Omnitrophota bacterium]
MHPDEIRALIRQAIPDAHAKVEDTTGTGDHFEIYVVSRAFEGKMLIEQHRLVQQSLQAAFADGRIHAVQIKTETPSEWAK